MNLSQNHINIDFQNSMDVETFLKFSEILKPTSMMMKAVNRVRYLANLAWKALIRSKKEEYVVTQEVKL